MSSGRIRDTGKVKKGVATTLTSDIPVGITATPPAVAGIHSKIASGFAPPPPSDPFKSPPLYFNQIGNNPADLFEVPVEVFKLKSQPFPS